MTDDGSVVVDASAYAPEQALPSARYKLGALLGSGGMGEVLTARDEQIGRSVAIKRMRGKAPPPDEIARFMREAKIQGRLDHPAIVPVHELWQDADGRPAFAMKQLSGVTLADIGAKLAAGDEAARQEFTRQRLLRAFADVCLAMEFAHTRGVVHRDLKPANIVVGDFGEVYVLDWGIAYVKDAADNDPQNGNVLGTPGYMSPEQLMGVADLDGRSDVYGLGAILHELLTDKPLHERTTAIDSTMNAVTPSPSERVPDRDVPPELDAICAQALAFERSMRFQTARELGRAVQKFLDGDRDLAMRKALASAELEKAEAAVKRGNHAEDRRLAVRAAGRALALDPTGGAAELVATLMMKPPDEVPAEVSRELEKLDDDARFASRRLTVAMLCSYLSFWPILYFSGLREGWFFGGGAAVCACTAIAVLSMPRAQSRLVGWVGLVGNLVMIVMFGLLAGPFTAAPGIAVITAMTFSAHIRVGRSFVVATAIVGALMLPWLLGVAGFVKRGLNIDGDALVFHTAASELHPEWATAGMLLYVPLLIGMAVFLTRVAVADRRKAQTRVELQAWQLQQLLTG